MVTEIAQIDHRRMSRLAGDASRPRPFRACLMVLALVAAGTAGAGCAQGQMTPDSGTPSTQATMAPVNPALAAGWAARPAYTHASAATEEAYRYAMEHPLVLQWIPCYCGCGAMGHGSNLDCYFEPQGDGPLVFEEHASYCSICVDITLRTKQLAAANTPLVTIRGAIDAEFGGAGPGTDTAKPG
jgi:membrane protease subunit (stomatin/prohibitin family)